ncbi:MAG: methyltransferase domain-containing protein, partial [Burkholderiales bacterium]|nr:methyltransferase domain-containing protein [Burkholderiales bacterium]
RVWARWTGSARPVVQSALAPLPVRPQSSAMVWSNLMLHRVSDPAVAFRDWRLALRPGGLLMFSTLGPDTLREWRGARRAAGLGDDRSPFIDMHDIGDALVHAGFADPVMDMEQLTVTYGDVESLARELRGLGSIGPAHDAGRGLGGRDRWRRIAQGYEPWRRDGRLPATVEVVYGHAWVPEQGPRRTTDGLDVVRIHRAPGRR